ncbi:hypothetical protein E05_50880 [Plautia stali symbiont]|nr:hypothetical protein E05_50880 [Plautia stali symbiont]
MITGMPKYEMVFTMRRMHEKKMSLLLKRIVTARVISSTFLLNGSPTLDLSASIFLRLNMAIIPPVKTHNIANQSVPVSPNAGIVRLGRKLPTAPMPNVYTAQNQPVAAATRLDGNFCTRRSTNE